MLLQNLADAVCSVFSVRTSRSFFLIGESPASFSRNFRHSDCSGFLPSVPCKRLPLPDVCCLFLLLRCWHIFIYRCIMRCDHIDLRPLLIKNTLFPFLRASGRSHNNPLFLYPCCFLHAAILPLHTSLQKYGYFKPCCQADFSQTVGFQFCDRGIFRIIQHLKRNFCTFCRFSM